MGQHTMRTPAPPTGARSGRSTGCSTGRSTNRDKKGRLKGFLVTKLRERNGLVSDDPFIGQILDEEAERLLGKPASEGELRKAEKRIMHRLQGGSAVSSRMPSRRSGGGDVAMTGRSALSHASSVLDEVATQRSSARRMDASTLLQNPKEEGGYDYWLRFMEMDVRNFQREEQIRKAEQKKRMEDQRKYLDEQVTMKAKAKKAAREADLSWGLEIKKDYDKWQEENIVA